MASLGQPDRPSSSMLSAAHFSLCYKKETPSQVFMNYLGRHSFLTEVLDNRSDFKFLFFANVSHPPLLSALHKQPSMTTCFSHSQCPSIDLYPYVIYVNKHSVQCIVGLFGGDAPPLLLTIEACNH